MFIMKRGNSRFNNCNLIKFSHLSKRSQATIFIIIAIVMIAVIVIYFYLKNERQTFDSGNLTEIIPDPEAPAPGFYQPTVYTDPFRSKIVKDKKSGFTTVKTEFSVEKEYWDVLPSDLNMQELYDAMKYRGMQTKITTLLEGIAVEYHGHINSEDLKNYFLELTDNFIDTSNFYYRNSSGSMLVQDLFLDFTASDRAVLEKILDRGLKSPMTGTIGGGWLSDEPEKTVALYPKGSIIILATDEFKNPLIEIWVNDPDRGGFGIKPDVYLNKFNREEKIVFNKLFRGTMISPDPNSGEIPVNLLYYDYLQEKGISW